MKNKDKWSPSNFQRDASGRILDTHMHKIIGKAYGKVIREHSSGLLADIGCGSVPYYNMYKDLVTDNVCVDWGKEDGEVSYLDYVADLNKEIPLESDQFNTIVCTDVLEHISNPALLFSEMSRIMKKEAKIIITVPFMYWVHDAPYDYHRYTRFMLSEYCNRNQLNVLSVEEYGGLPEILYDLVYKGYIFYNLPLRKAFLYCWKVLGTFLYRRSFVKRWSARSRETFPLGYVLVAQKL